MPINKYHEELGHPNFALTCETEKAQSIKPEGPSMPCSACALSKAQQKCIPKSDMKPQAKTPAKQLFLDILSQKKNKALVKKITGF